MAYGNGSHSKRGWLRPGPGSRIPAFLIIVLAAGCSFLVYNLYTTTVDRNSLGEELGLVKKKLHACQRDKRELETRFEQHTKALRTVKEEVEGLRAAERGSVEIQKELKQCREQIATMQTENAELKDGKTELESCQRKVKDAEEKWESWMQEKSRLQGEVEKCRGELREAPRRQSSNYGGLDGPQQPSKEEQKLQQVLAAQNEPAPPEIPHRGAPEEIQKAPVVANQVPSHDINTQDQVAIPHGLPADRGQLNPVHVTVSHPISSANAVQNQTLQGQGVPANGGKFNPIQGQGSQLVSNDNAVKNQSGNIQLGEKQFPVKIGVTSANVVLQEKMQSPLPVLELANNNSGDVVKNKDAAGGRIAAASPEAVDTAYGAGNNTIDSSNATSIHESGEAVGVHRREPSDEKVGTYKRKKDKERNLNKVIEESAQMDDRRRGSPDAEGPRGEQDDDAPEVAANEINRHLKRPKLLANSERKMDIGEKAGYKQAVNERNAANDYRNLANEMKAARGRHSDENNSNKDQRMAIPPSSDEPKEMDMRRPKNGSPQEAKPVNRKGLKDDYHYKDDEEESDTAVKGNGGAVGRREEGNIEHNERNGPPNGRMAAAQGLETEGKHGSDYNDQQVMRPPGAGNLNDLTN